MSDSSPETRRGNWLVAIATYNEIDSLPGLAARIWSAFPEADILVVDDASPDGTGAWCDEQSDSRLFCLHRQKKKGLGSAAADGFAWGLARGYSWIGTIDADGSHDPKDFRQMFHAMQLDAALDAVIGSRYTPGGSIVGWPWYRRLASQGVNQLTRLWLRLPTRDNSSAFRLYRASALRRIQAARISCRGYAYLEEILWRLRRAGGHVREIPIAFHQRVRGQSKLGLPQACVTLLDLLLLPWRKAPSG
jgi:dolichol-phosphate mannosyltransferase